MTGSSGVRAPAAAASALRPSPLEETKGSAGSGGSEVWATAADPQVHHPQPPPAREGRDEKAGPGGGGRGGAHGGGGHSSFLRIRPPRRNHAPRLSPSPAAVRPRPRPVTHPLLDPRFATPASYHPDRSQIPDWVSVPRDSGAGEGPSAGPTSLTLGLWPAGVGEAERRRPEGPALLQRPPPPQFLAGSAALVAREVEKRPESP